MWHKRCRIQKNIYIYYKKFTSIFRLHYILFFAKLAYVIANGKKASVLPTSHLLSALGWFLAYANAERTQNGAISHVYEGCNESCRAKGRQPGRKSPLAAGICLALLSHDTCRCRCSSSKSSQERRGVGGWCNEDLVWNHTHPSTICF